MTNSDKIEKTFKALLEMNAGEYLKSIMFLLELALYGIQEYCKIEGTNRNNDVVAPLIIKAITSTQNINRK